MVTLKPMTKDEFARFKTASQQGFARQLSSAEQTSYEATLKEAEIQFDRLVPEGSATAGQLFYTAQAEGVAVGWLWLAIQERFGQKIAMINDIQINESARGKGYGRRVMQLAEAEAKRAGAGRIRLHVFAENTAARKLYDDLGFQATSLNMMKVL